MTMVETSNTEHARDSVAATAAEMPSASREPGATAGAPARALPSVLSAFHGLGIGAYLVALILLSVVPLCLAAAVLIVRQSQLQEQAFEQSLLQTASALTLAVDRQLATFGV